MKKKSTLGRVLTYIGKYKFLLPVSILLAIASVFLTLYIPILVGDAITVIEEIIPAIGENSGADILDANKEMIVPVCHGQDKFSSSKSRQVKCILGNSNNKYSKIYSVLQRYCVTSVTMSSFKPKLI